MMDYKDIMNIDLEEFEQMDMRSRVKTIKQAFHRSAPVLLDEIEQSARRVISAHYKDYEGLSGIYLNFMEIKALTIMDNNIEDRDLFVKIIQKTAKKEEIEDARNMHEDIRELWQELRELTDDFTPPADTCPTHIDLYEMLSEMEKLTLASFELEDRYIFN
ncbi:MAG: hemerythrin domain-containing protein [Ezakiella sp.]|nr:hemerythrin domain-containing protein [Bacillota bacterium]MDY3947555.1 hemerythrin domain-containing protein [Ezakiella sp.]